MKIILKDYKTNEVIKFIRENAGLTQAEFGKKINKTTRMVQYYESGEKSYNIKLLKEITDKFNLDIIIKDRK